MSSHDQWESIRQLHNKEKVAMQPPVKFLQLLRSHIVSRRIFQCGWDLIGAIER